MLLRDKKAVVTGGNRGIGRGIVLRLAKEGASVLVAGRDLAAAEQVATEARAFTASSFALQVDVSSEENVTEMFDAAMDHWGRIDILVNNAGVSSMSRIEDLSDEEWDENLDINAKGLFRACRSVIPIMRKQGSGKIVNIASLAAKVGAEFLGHYAASKFAVLGLTKTLALELASANIQVNAICPGIIETDMIRREWKWEARLRNTTPEAVRQSFLDAIPLGRLGTPDDVAKVTAFLASGYADYMTGQAINVTGGMETH